MTGRTASPADISSARVVARFPATANQRMYWREIAAAPGDPRLNAVFRRRFAGRLGDDAIASAMQSLVDRHEILRTRFLEDADGELQQEILEGVRFKLDHIDLRPLPEEQRQAEMLRLGGAAARRPFSFANGQSETPLFAALLIRTSPEEAYLHLIFHHLVIDGWSLDLVVREIGTLASAADAGRTADLPHVAMHFGDFARWQSDLLAGDTLDGARAYWSDKLADLPDFRVEPDRAGAPEGKPSEIKSILLPTDLSDAFENLARKTNHTLFSLAGAAAASALQGATGASEIVFGTQLAGRDDPDSEAIVGPVINTAILRVPTPGESSFMKVADAVRTNIREAMAHQLLPFAEIDRMLSKSRGAEIPAYRVNLVVQRTYISSATVHDSSYGAFKIESVAAPSVGALWDLSLFMVGRAEGWRLSCEFPPELYDGQTIDGLLSAWRGAIEKAVASPDFSLPGNGGDSALEAGSGQAAPVAPARNPRIEALLQRILTLQPKGEEAPVIAINNASVLYPVAKAIGPERPFYDLQFCPSAEPVELPHRHFADHARDAVEMIRLAQPRGPYILFGLCIMGALAIEAARILQSEGEEVELVVLNDTYRPGYRERMGFIDRNIRAWQVRYLTTAKLLARMRAGELSFADVLANYRIGRALRLPQLAQLFGSGRGKPAPDAMVKTGRWFAEGVLLPSQSEFTMEPYRGRVVMFRSQDVPTGRLFPRDFGWAGYVDGEFEVVDCPGTHDTMFRAEGAEVIGAVVRRKLAERG